MGILKSKDVGPSVSILALKHIRHCQLPSHTLWYFVFREWSLIEVEFHLVGHHVCITCLMSARHSSSTGDKTTNKAKFLTLDSSF